MGREHELAALGALRKEAARGPCFVLLGGEAGVGKSRLLAEFRRRLPLRSSLFAQGECSDVAPAPFAPFIAMLASAAPEIARRLSVAPPRVDHGEAAVRALFNDVCGALEQLAAKRTAFLVLEDLHFADTDTLALLAHLARTFRGPRLLAIATYRAEALEANDELLATIARLVRLPHVHTLDLASLAKPEARALAVSSLPPELARDLAFVDALVARADGNPFFLEELVKHAAAHGDTASLPRSVRAVILERLATLPASDRALLAHAAVFGRTFHVELLRTVVGAEHGELLAVLGRARDAGLIVEEPGTAERLRFRHALTREAVLGDLLTLERRPLHASIVAALEALPLAERDARRPELAYHAFEAGDLGKAVRYGEAAGDEAAAIHAYSDAAQHYGRVVYAGAIPNATRRRLLRKLGDNLHWSRSARAARRAYDEALELARAAADADDAGGILLQIARQHYALGNTAEAIASAKDAIDVLAQAGAPALRDVAAGRLALYHLFRLETASAQSVLATIEHPAAPDVAPLYHQVRVGTFAVDFQRGAWEAEARSYLAAAERNGETEFSLALHNVADSAVATGELRLADAWLRESLQLERSKVSGENYAFTVGALAYERYLSGDLAEARQVAEAALAGPGRSAMSDFTPTAAAIWAGLALGDDAFAELAFSEELVEIALASGQSQNMGNVVGASADLLAERGRGADARRLLRRGLDRIAHPYLCETFLFVAARHAAESDLERVRAIAAHPSRPSSHPLCGGTIALVEALIAMRRGDEAQTREHAMSAAAHLGEIGWKPFEAEALEVAGQAAEAADLYRSMGHVRGLRRLAARQVRTPRSHARPSAALLSRREREIAALVAVGKANRGIAHDLGIAEKTVEHHLSSVSAKLEITSRAQLVLALTEHPA